MDNLDRTIIEILQIDGRTSNAQMARKLRLSEGTVRRRLGKLVRDGSIRVVAIIDPEQLGYHFAAVIGLRVAPTHAESVATKLASLPEVEHVAITTGRYDVLARVNLESSEALSTFLHHKIGTVEGVRETETFVSLETRKRAHGPSIL